MMGEGDKTEPKGVRGWLLLLVLILTILGPANGAWNTYTAWQELRTSNPAYLASDEGLMLQTASWMTYGTGLVLSVATGVLLATRHRPGTVRLAILSLWIVGPVLSLLGYFVGLAAVGDRPLLADLKFLLSPTALALLWSAYLLKSRRVKNTFNFHGLGDPARAAEDTQ